MSLTLSQFLFSVITIALVVAITVFAVFIMQLRKTAKQGEETLIQVREFVANLKEISQKVNTKIDDLGPVLESTKKIAGSLSEISWFLTSKILKPSSKYWPLLFPLLRLGWRRMKKRKEEKNGK